MADIRYSRSVPKAIPFEWWQAGEVAPIDCSTFVCAIDRTTLPWMPTVQAINPALGKYQIGAPSEAQAAQMQLGKRYGVHVVLRSAGGVATEEFDLTLVAV